MTNPILPDVPMPIITQRLILRPLQVNDAPAIYEAKRESWAELHPWMIWAWKPLEEMTLADDEAFCAKKQTLFVSREDITLLIFHKETGKYLGGCGLHKIDWQKRFFTVGFWIRTSEIGNGYATEAAKALIRYAFDVLSANKVITFHADGNIGSQRVIEKAGFGKEGVLRKQHSLYDRLVDEHMYGLLK